MNVRRDLSSEADFGAARFPASWRPALDVIWLARLHPLGAAGVIVVLALLACAILAPALAPKNPYEFDYANRFAPPFGRFALGTDNFGRDILSRLIYGARLSLMVSLSSVLLGSTVGALLGLIGGARGGKLDFAVQRLMDVLLAFPTLLLVLTVVAALGPSVGNVTLAIATVLVPGCARVVRSSALSIKDMEFINAAHAVGCPTTGIVFRHILPNCLAPWIIFATASLGWAILVEASLSFLGLGAPPEEPSWGNMLSLEGRDYLEKAPWISVAPGVAITLTVFGFNMIGDAVRDILDPRQRGT